MRLVRPVLWATALLAVLGASATATASSSHAARGTSLAGTWKGQYSGAVSGTFTLHWRKSGSALHGTIKLSNPSGTYDIGGSVHRKAIKFGAVGVGATYTGTVAGKSMSGTWKSGQGGGSWSARQTKST
jgi:hypothetical protein